MSDGIKNSIDFYQDTWVRLARQDLGPSKGSYVKTKVALSNLWDGYVVTRLDFAHTCLTGLANLISALLRAVLNGAAFLLVWVTRQEKFVARESYFREKAWSEIKAVGNEGANAVEGFIGILSPCLTAWCDEVRDSVIVKIETYFVKKPTYKVLTEEEETLETYSQTEKIKVVNDDNDLYSVETNNNSLNIQTTNNPSSPIPPLSSQTLSQHYQPSITSLKKTA